MGPRSPKDARLRATAPPDLLNARPMATVDLEGLAEAFDFAFTAGDDGGAWDRALARAPIGDSSWEPAYFAADLFLEDFVEICLL
ncbi:MAG: DNA mismatch repair protein, partial [Polyangiaceae bacterium]|nr:DNA mismatch repair protein [Polyangiaceae bacterium]